jgi:putative phosphoribosyl transferase
MGTIVEDKQLRQKRSIFKDRADPGQALLRHLEKFNGKEVIILAIPSGGLPIAAEIAKGLHATLDVVIVRKLRTPRNPEAGFGAISLSGDTILNEELVANLELSEEQIDQAKENALSEGRFRERILRGDRPPTKLADKLVIISDDGLASGYTMLAAIKGVKAEHPSKIIVAVPTGSDRSVDLVAKQADEVICLNIRSMPFAVADAYRNWYDVDQDEAVRLLRYGGWP